MSTTLTIEPSGGLFLPPEMLESAHFLRGAKIEVDVADDRILLKAGRLIISGAPPLTDADVSRAIRSNYFV